LPVLKAVVEGVDHRRRFLGAGGAVEEDERELVRRDRLVEDGEVGADGGGVERGEWGGNFGG
jgi:hypothetical protein